MRRSKADESSARVWVNSKIRTVYIAGDIEMRMASRFRRLFHRLEKDSAKPIIVEINTYGGEEYAGMLIMDTIQLSRCEVTTRATGAVMSMGACILVAGDRREALPSASIMIHQGTHAIKARCEEVQIEVEESMHWEEVLWNIMDDRTQKPRGYWKSRCGGKNLYLDANQALAEGFIHEQLLRSHV